MSRKIIQILDTPDNDYYQGHLTALCDDGSVWFFQGEWQPLLKQIPQGTLSNETKWKNTTKLTLEKTIKKLENTPTSYLIPDQAKAATHMKHRLLTIIKEELSVLLEEK